MYNDTEFEDTLHRTWLDLLLAGNYTEVAALVVDANLRIIHGDFQPTGVNVDLPSSAFIYVSTDPSLKHIIEETLNSVFRGRLVDQNGFYLEKFSIEYRIKLVEMESNWRDIVKELIVNAKDSNQGVITEKVFSRRRQEVLTYNEMKFGSQSEIRIAQELEQRKVLFFPLALAIRADTGIMYKDHREADFLNLPRRSMGNIRSILSSQPLRGRC